MLNANGGVSSRPQRPENPIPLESRVDLLGQRYRYANINNSQHYSAANVSQLHASTSVDTSKHSNYANSILTPIGMVANGGLNLTKNTNRSFVNKPTNKVKQVGVKEMLISLALLCLVSLLLALLSMIFLLKISPVTASEIRELLRAEQLTVITAEEYVVVYEVTLALCALTLSLNLCCLLVCAIQFLFALKLVKNQNEGCHR